MLLAPLTMPNAARYDANAFSWIGSLTSDPFVGYVWHKAPVQSLEDAKTKQLVVGAVELGDKAPEPVPLVRERLP